MNIINLANWCASTANVMKLTDKSYLHSSRIRLALLKAPLTTEISTKLELDPELAAILAADPVDQYLK